MIDLPAALARITELERQLGRAEELARVYRAQRNQAQEELHVAETAAADWERIFRTHKCPTEPTNLENDSPYIDADGDLNAAGEQYLTNIRARQDLPGPFGTSCPCGSTLHVLSSHPTRNFPFDIPDPIAAHRDGEHEQELEPECCAACVVALSQATGISRETYAKYIRDARRQTPTEGPPT